MDLVDAGNARWGSNVIEDLRLRKRPRDVVCLWGTSATLRGGRPFVGFWVYGGNRSLRLNLRSYQSRREDKPTVLVT